jgi:type 1 glutamine amidotransferase
VYYTSFGHREDIWTNPAVQRIILGGFAWALGNVDADVTPNIDRIAPQANELPKPAKK